jgi:hypothetical protein
LAEAKGLEGSKCWFEVAHPMDQPTKLMRAVAWAAVVAPLAIAFEARVVEAPLVKFRSAWTQVDEPAEALLRRNQRRLLVEHREGLEALRSLSSAGVAEECLVAVFDEGCQFVLWDPRM